MSVKGGPMRVSIRFSLMLAAFGALLSAQAPGRIAVTAAARSIRPGELVVLTIATGVPPTALRVRAFDKEAVPFQVDSRTWRVVVGIDLTTPPGTYMVDIDAGGGTAEDMATHALVVKPRAFPTRTITVAEGFVNPPPDTVARIQQEARELEQLWQSSAPSRLWHGPFVRPVPDPANSAFGARSIFNGQPRSPHGGADFLSPAGRPIEAPNAGRIALARNLYFTGNTVVIDHGLGLFSLFAHLSAFGVEPGALVGTGDVVGRVGATGRVSGPHLHWTVRAGGARVDPLSLLAVLGKKPKGGK
jgi:murein DD-endopeptidase MepM/ murein hydrolase activator NlpD